MRCYLSKLLAFVSATVKTRNIDESHGLLHSMKTLQFAQQIYSVEEMSIPNLKNQKNVIDACCILHDMCDGKYMDSKEGVSDIDTFLREECREFIDTKEVDVVKTIITTMSYSKVVANGYPDLAEYQDAYHIVREADLLAAYDVDRCLIYNISKMKHENMHDVFKEASRLFSLRMHAYITKKYFVHNSAKKIAEKLHNESESQLQLWQKILLM